MINSYTRDKEAKRLLDEKLSGREARIKELERSLSLAEDKLFGIGRAYKNLNDLLSAEIVLPPTEQKPSKKGMFNDDYLERTMAESLGLTDDDDDQDDDWTDDDDN